MRALPVTSRSWPASPDRQRTQRARRAMPCRQRQRPGGRRPIAGCIARTATPRPRQRRPSSGLAPRCDSPDRSRARRFQRSGPLVRLSTDETGVLEAMSVLVSAAVGRGVENVRGAASGPTLKGHIPREEIRCRGPSCSFPCCRVWIGARPPGPFGASRPGQRESQQGFDLLEREDDQRGVAIVQIAMKPGVLRRHIHH